MADAVKVAIPDWIAARRWHVLYVVPQMEFAVQAMLRKAGHTALLPTIGVWRRVNRYAKRKRQVRFPLLVRYVVVGTEATRWPKLLAQLNPLSESQLSEWVLGLVVDGDSRARIVPHAQLARFVAEHGDGIEVPAEQRHMRTHHEFGVGDEVAIVDGAYAGWSGTVRTIVGDEARMLLPLFGAEREVRIGLASLEALA